MLGRKGPGPDWGAGASGQKLGGAGTEQGSGEAASAEELRRRSLEAAEKRQASAPGGVSKAKLGEMAERQAKEDLIGRITAHYQRKKMEAPMGLNIASLEQLKKRYKQIQNEE